MKNIQGRAAAAIAVVAVLTTGGVTVAQSSDAPPSGDPPIPAVDSGDQSAGPDALATNCKKTFNSGAGITRFSWCFSDDGNIMKLEHSAGLEHVFLGVPIEGYCISSNNIKRGESDGLSNNGLSAATYPSTTKVVHTAGGVLKVEQAFAQTTGTKLITITMKVTNVSGVQQDDVFLTRFIDADMSNTAEGDVWSSASRSVSVSEPGSSRLELLPTSTQFVANSMIYPNYFQLTNASCYDAGSDATTTAGPADQSMGVLYQLGTMLPGATKTAKFVYQVTI